MKVKKVQSGGKIKEKGKKKLLKKKSSGDAPAGGKKSSKKVKAGKQQESVSKKSKKGKKSKGKGATSKKRAPVDDDDDDEDIDSDGDGDDGVFDKQDNKKFGETIDGIMDRLKGGAGGSDDDDDEDDGADYNDDGDDDDEDGGGMSLLDSLMNGGDSSATDKNKKSGKKAVQKGKKAAPSAIDAALAGDDSDSDGGVDLSDMIASIGSGEKKKDDDWGAAADKDDGKGEDDGDVTFDDLLAGLNNVKDGALQKHVKDLSVNKAGGNDIGAGGEYMGEAKRERLERETQYDKSKKGARKWDPIVQNQKSQHTAVFGDYTDLLENRSTKVLSSELKLKTTGASASSSSSSSTSKVAEEVGFEDELEKAIAESGAVEELLKDRAAEQGAGFTDQSGKAKDFIGEATMNPKVKDEKT